MTLSMNSLRDGYTALVAGASGAIGQAFVHHLKQDPRCAQVIECSRRSDPPIELDNESTLVRYAQAVTAQAPLHLVIDATGALTIDGLGPEKRLEDLHAIRLQRAMMINAIGPALLLQQLQPLLANGERVIWAKLSARVGSIEDNQKGGWYGYRASKAALNMLLQTTAIELARRRPLAVLAALQPGTVRSALSAPFVGEAALDPLQSVAGLLAALDGSGAERARTLHRLSRQGHTVVMPYHAVMPIWRSSDHSDLSLCQPETSLRSGCLRPAYW